jgi:hypothetical protein
MARRLAIVVVLALVVVGLAQLFLPRIVAQGLEVGLAGMLGGEPEVRLRAYPALRLLLGRIDQLTVETHLVEAGALVFDTFSSTLEDLAINLRALLADRTLVVERVGRQTATIRISQDSLRRYLAATVPRLQRPEVLLEPGRARFRGQVSMAGRTVTLTMEGTFAFPPDDRSRVVFNPTRLQFDGVVMEVDRLPEWLNLLGGPELFIDLARFPLPLRGTEVWMEPGWLIITGEAAE